MLILVAIAEDLCGFRVATGKLAVNTSSTRILASRVKFFEWIYNLVIDIFGAHQV